MPSYTRHMREQITYWPPAGNDGFGGRVYGAPESRLCRWQDDAVLFRDAQGREVVSESIVYVNSPVVEMGKLYRGISVSGVPEATAKEIRQVGDSPNLTQSLSLTKVYL
jgi:hypothetical protein